MTKCWNFYFLNKFHEHIFLSILMAACSNSVVFYLDSWNGGLAEDYNSQLKHIWCFIHCLQNPLPDMQAWWLSSHVPQRLCASGRWALTPWWSIPLLLCNSMVLLFPKFSNPNPSKFINNDCFSAFSQTISLA